MLLILMAFSLDCISVILLPLGPASLMHRNPQRRKIVAVNFGPAITCILVDTSFCCSERFFVFQ